MCHLWYSFEVLGLRSSRAFLSFCSGNPTRLDKTLWIVLYKFITPYVFYPKSKISRIKFRSISTLNCILFTANISLKVMALIYPCIFTLIDHYCWLFFKHIFSEVQRNCWRLLLPTNFKIVSYKSCMNISPSFFLFRTGKSYVVSPNWGFSTTQKTSKEFLNKRKGFLVMTTTKKSISTIQDL